MFESTKESNEESKFKFLTNNSNIYTKIVNKKSNQVALKLDDTSFFSSNDSQELIGVNREKIRDFFTPRNIVNMSSNPKPFFEPKLSFKTYMATENNPAIFSDRTTQNETRTNLISQNSTLSIMVMIILSPLFESINI